MSKHSPPLRVLVVDDESLIRWSLVETLTGSGYEASEAKDGQGAVDALAAAATPFDVVLLDLRLPDTNGLAVLSELRQLSPATKVILMTAYGTPEVVGEAMDRGAYRVVAKPLEMSDLSNLVQQAYGSRS